jgi:uncharacterized protein YjdB
MRKSSSRILLLVAASLLAIVPLAAAQQSRAPQNRGAKVPRVSGVVHVEDLGDRPLENHEWAGTRGESKRLEGFSLNIDSPDNQLRVEYLCHIEDRGDIGWLTEGSFCGTKGESRRLEGLAIRLAGPQARRYSIRYQCHVEELGDTKVMSDGAFCGTRGEAKRLEALQVWIVRK